MFVLKRVICGLMVFLMFQECAFAYQIGNMEIKLLGSVSETFDDNISFVKDNPKSDYITNISVGMNGQYNGKRSSMTLSGNIRHQLFKENRNFNNTSEDLALNFSRELSKYDRFNLNYSFVHAEEPRSFEDQFGNTNARYSYSKNRFSLGYTHDISKQLSTNLKYFHNTDSRSSSSGVGDSYMNKIETGLNYALSSDLIILGSYYYSKRKFKSGPFSFSHVFSGGVRRYLTKQLSLDVNSGIDFTTSYDKTKIANPLFNVSLNDEIDENTYTRIAFSKKYEATENSQNIFNNWRVSCDFMRQLFKRLSLFLSASYGKGEYKSINTKENFTGGNAGLTYDIRENIKATLSYGYSKRTSNISTNGFTKNVIYFAITIEF